MAQDHIRFRRIEEADSGLVAVAQVSLFPGVWLRGWNILKRGSDIEVVPPYKVYKDPQSGEKRVLPLLFFERDETRRKWVAKVKDEYLKWEAARQAEPSSVAAGQPTMKKTP